jgi:uncharacterized membrane protein YgcG
MEPRNWIGIVMLIAGIIIQPIGWMYAFWLQLVSFVFIVLGVSIFFTQKLIERMEERERSAGHPSHHPMPGDIHDYNGWGHGGRSTSWTSGHDSGGSDGGGGE